MQWNNPFDLLGYLFERDWECQSIRLILPVSLSFYSRARVTTTGNQNHGPGNIRHGGIQNINSTTVRASAIIYKVSLHLVSNFAVISCLLLTLELNRIPDPGALLGGV